VHQFDKAEEKQVFFELTWDRTGGNIPKLASPQTPHQNGVVERRLPILRMRAPGIKDANVTTNAKEL